MHSAKAAEIQGMRIGQHPDKARVVIEMIGEVDFQARVEDHPKRLVLHLPVKNWSVPNDVVMASPFLSVKHEAIGNGLMRLTMPMEKPYIVRSAFMIAGEAGLENRLVIDMVPVPEIEFAHALSTVHGPLFVPNSTKVASLDDLIAGFVENDGIPAPQPQAKPVTMRKPVIVIDPGHGGKDPGAISPRGIKEKDITLSMAKTIVAILNKSGRYDARLTRSDDRFIKLYNRVKIARAAKADLFMSIHADSVGNNQTRGASVYTLSNTASDKQTEKLAARENRADLIGGIDLNVEDEDVSAILIDLSMRETMNQSKTLANTVVGGLRTGGVNTLKGPHRYAGFAVLKAPDVPSVLIETGFVSNEAEARTLLSKSHQEKIARSLLKSLDQYYGRSL